MKRIATVVAALAAFVLTAPAQAATWVVDSANPEVECQNADSPTINNVPSGALENTRIELNEFDRDDNAISLSGQVVDVSIGNNSFVGHRLTGVFVNGARIEVSRNAFESVTQSIRVVGFQPNRVAYNDVLLGRVNGIAFLGGRFAAVAHNHVVQTTGDGIALQGFINGDVRGNQVEASGRHGLHLFNGTRNSMIEVNRSRANGADGIRVDETSAVNRINNNQFDANGEHDCHDDTVGPLPGGTRYCWEHNLGDTANRPEICKPTGQPEGEPALLPPTAMTFLAEPPCMPFSQARETQIESSGWDKAPWICDPTPDELGPAPEEP